MKPVPLAPILVEVLPQRTLEITVATPEEWQRFGSFELENYGVLTQKNYLVSTLQVTKLYDLDDVAHHIAGDHGIIESAKLPSRRK